MEGVSITLSPKGMVFNAREENVCHASPAGDTVLYLYKLGI